MRCSRLLAALGLCALSAQPSWAEDTVSAGASYIVTLAGLNIATLLAEITEETGRYSIEMSASLTGLGNLVSSGTARATAGGIVGNPQLVSERFTLDTHAQGESFSVAVTYRDRAVESFRVEPPLREGADRVAIERAHLSGVIDMISGLVIKADALDARLCERRLPVFTGVERFDVAMSFAGNDEATSPRTGYQGPVVLCTLRYLPIAGHYRNSEITAYLADTSRILLWYAPLGATGYYIPYRALLGTSAGDLSLVLTGLRL